MSINTPLDVLRRLLSSAPKSLAEAVMQLLRLLAWPWMIVSFAGIISDLAATRDFFVWLFHQAAALQPILHAFGAVISPALDVWHGLWAPVQDWISRAVHFTIPSFALDLFLLMLLPAVRLALAFQSARRLKNIPVNALGSIPEIQSMDIGPFFRGDPKAYKLAIKHVPPEHRRWRQVMIGYLSARRVAIAATILSVIGLAILLMDLAYRNKLV